MQHLAQNLVHVRSALPAMASGGNDTRALKAAFLETGDVAELRSLVAQAGVCRTHICHRVMADARNRACTRAGCRQHALNAAWLQEAQKLARLDREYSHDIKVLKDAAAGLPLPVLMYVKAACFVERRRIGDEELRSGVARPPQAPPVPPGSKKAGGTTTRQPRRNCWADIMVATEEEEEQQSDDGERRKSPRTPEDADQRSLMTETETTEEAQSERAEAHVALLEQELEASTRREARLSAALAEAEAEAVRWRQAAEERAPEKALAQLADSSVQATDQKGEDAEATASDVLRDVLRILEIETSNPEKRIAFVLENYRRGP